MRAQSLMLFSLPIAFSSCGIFQQETGKQPKAQPNIIIIMSDDSGFSDFGCYGSEISTPNLDRMASEGLQMMQFYNQGRCCPSRASLLTGLYPTQAGMGHMSFGLKLQPSAEQVTEYQGYFPSNVPTIADILRLNGYHTLHVGKWHVGDHPENRPWKHGFDKVLAQNAGGHYFNYPGHTINLWYNDSIKQVPDGAHLTDVFTEQAIEFIKNTPDEKPFFLYLAYTAPHFPLQAFSQDIEKYIPVYEKGWESVRQARFLKLRKMGLIHPESILSEAFYRQGITPRWDELNAEEKNSWILRMATHAAMTEQMDRGIGQILNYLEGSGKSDHTIIMFLSDNGADNMEVYNIYQNRRDPNAEIGSPGSFDGIGPAWANAANSPFWLFKSWTSEGGIATPFIAWGPSFVSPGTINATSTGNTMDLMPTALELAGASFPETHNGLAATPPEGRSLVPIFKGEDPEEQPTYCWEHQGHKAIRKGNWKLVFVREVMGVLECKWHLFDLVKDRGETTNLIEIYPDIAKDLFEDWNAWAYRTGVRPWSDVNIWNREWECENAEPVFTE